MNSEILFEEIQKKKPWWAWLLLAALNGFMAYAVYSQLVMGKPLGDNPATDVQLLIIVSFVLLFSVLLINIRLETKIKPDGIYVRFFPFHIKYRFFSWTEIGKCYIRSYKPLAEYGGWGIKGTRKNKAFNYSGREGLQLELTNGNKVLIGTKKTSELNELLIKTGKKY